MRRLRHWLRAPQRHLELLPADTPAPDAAPAWDALPDRTRQALTGLMARLLVAHASGAAVGATPMNADNICARHLARKAVLYVRQSSPYQVQHNREGQTLQYAMHERLGWAEVEVIDDDLGRSASPTDLEEAHATAHPIQDLDEGFPPPPQHIHRAW